MSGRPGCGMANAPVFCHRFLTPNLPGQSGNGNFLPLGTMHKWSICGYGRARRFGRMIIRPYVTIYGKNYGVIPGNDAGIGVWAKLQFWGEWTPAPKVRGRSRPPSKKIWTDFVFPRESLIIAHIAAKEHAKRPKKWLCSLKSRGIYLSL